MSADRDKTDNVIPIRPGSRNVRVTKDSPQARRLAAKLAEQLGEGPVTPGEVAAAAPLGSKISLRWPAAENTSDHEGTTEE